MDSLSTFIEQNYRVIALSEGVPLEACDTFLLAEDHTHREVKETNAAFIKMASMANSVNALLLEADPRKVSEKGELLCEKFYLKPHDVTLLSGWDFLGFSDITLDLLLMLLPICDRDNFDLEKSLKKLALHLNASDPISFNPDESAVLEWLNTLKFIQELIECENTLMIPLRRAAKQLLASDPEITRHTTQQTELLASLNTLQTQMAGMNPEDPLYPSLKSQQASLSIDLDTTNTLLDQAKVACYASEAFQVLYAQLPKVIQTRVSILIKALYEQTTLLFPSQTFSMISTLEKVRAMIPEKSRLFLIAGHLHLETLPSAIAKSTLLGEQFSYSRSVTEQLLSLEPLKEYMHGKKVAILASKELEDPTSA